MDDTFPLTVTVPAAEWGRLQRRLKFLEAALIQACRRRRQLKEWFSASELATLRLPGLPATRQGMFRKAQFEEWMFRIVEGQGGERYEFHFSSLPRRAFEDMIARIVSPAASEVDGATSTPQVGDAPPRPVAANASPPWMLPLMRIIRSDRNVGVDDAMRRLAMALPEDTIPPSRDEIAAAMARLGGRG